MQRLIVALLCAACISTAAAMQPSRPAGSFDVLIRNARVLDGSGNPWLRADLGFRGNRIVAVGRLAGATAGSVIDAADRLVTPGFIDVHSHAAETLAREPLRQGQPLIAQGITTIVGNPDGGGPVDLAAQRAALEQGGLGPNVALLVPHGSVRRTVMGSANRPPTGAELDAMRRLVARGMDEGACGLSSGLFYTPGSFATTEEVIELARVAGRQGGLYTSHIRDEGDYGIGVVAAVQEVIRVADEAGVIGIVSHMKALGPDNWGLAAALTTRIDGARARGVQVFADQYAYEASSTSLGAALLPGDIKVPPLAILQKDPATLGAEERALLADAEAALRENLRRRGGPAAVQIAFFKPEPALEGLHLGAIAARRGTTPERAALEMIAQGGASIVSFNMSEADIEQIMRQSYTMTSSDGGLVALGAGKPHPRNYGAFSRKLSRYVRERQTVSLEFAIRSMTSLPASVFGLRDRGVIREGAFADVLIFDPARVRDLATYTEPHQLSEGMDYVFVNGAAVIADGAFTVARPGAVLRRIP